MRNIKHILVTAFTSFLLTGSVLAQAKLSAIEAKNHIGDQATVCGQVVSTRYATTARGKPTFLNLDKPYPNQVFTILIWGENRDKFGTPEDRYRDKQVCVTGKITGYRGVPELVLGDPKDIDVQK